MLEINKEEDDLSSEEEHYRRGFNHGFYVGRNTETTQQEVNEWRTCIRYICPPGTEMAGLEFKKNEDK